MYDLQFLQENMFVIPVPFSKYHKEMLAHIKELLEYRNGYVSINPKHNKLITALRTAVEKGDGALDLTICSIVSGYHYSSGISPLSLKSSCTASQV